MNGMIELPDALADWTGAADGAPPPATLAVQLDPGTLAAGAADRTGLLRALAAGLAPGLPLVAHAPDDDAAAALAALVAETCPDRALVRVRGADSGPLRAAGTLCVPGPDLAGPAALRDRVGADAYSLLGLVHGVAAHRDLDAIAALVAAPVKPWDALVSPSVAVRDAVIAVLEAEVDRLRQRLGAARFPLPELPVIPPGVHAADFAFGAPERAAARARLAIPDAAVVVLTPGRDATSGPLLAALAVLVAEAPAPLCLVALDCAGPAESPLAEAPAGLRVIRLDGARARDRQDAWAAADLFVALPDGVADDGGATPLAAMAAGLPVIATDWNGNDETIRDGVDGFLIPTAMPAAGTGGWLSRRYQGGDCDFGAYAAAIAATVSLDGERLTRALRFLCGNAALRREMGARGQRLVREQYDWPQILRQYLVLAADLGDERRRASPMLPKVPPARQDPFRLLAGHATAAIDGTTQLRRGDGRLPGVPAPALAAATDRLDAERCAALLAALPETGFAMLVHCARAARLDLPDAIIAVAGLAKTGDVVLFRDADRRRAMPAVDLPRVQPPGAAPAPVVARRAGSA